MTKRSSSDNDSAAAPASNLQPISALRHEGGASLVTKPEDLSPKMVEDVADWLLSSKPGLAEQVMGALKQSAVPLSLLSLCIYATYWLEASRFEHILTPFMGAMIAFFRWIARSKNGRLERLNSALAEQGVPLKGRYRIARRLRRLFCGQVPPEKETIRKALRGPQVSTGSSSDEAVRDALCALSPMELMTAISTSEDNRFDPKLIFPLNFLILSITGNLYSAALTATLVSLFFENYLSGPFLSEYGYPKETGKAAQRFVRTELKKFMKDNKVRFSSQMTSGPYFERFVAQLYAQLQPASSKPIVALPESLRVQGFEKDGVYEGVVITGYSGIFYRVELAPGCIGFLPGSELWSWRALFLREGQRVSVKILGPWIDGRPLLSLREAIQAPKDVPALK